MKFLIIDDDKCIYFLLKKQISNCWKDAKIEHYNPEEQGIPHYNFEWSEYDIILLDYDIGLSGLTGIDILNKLKDIDDYPIVIMITGEGNEDVAVRAIQAGADDYLIKYDIVTDRLYKIINDAIILRRNTKDTSKPDNLTSTKNKEFSKYKSCNNISIPGYRNLELISSNVSMTWKAIQDVAEKTVAIKLQKVDKDTKSNAIKRFEQELDILSRLDHPNVIKIIDHGMAADYLFYSMEYIGYGDMSKMLNKGPLPCNLVKDYFLQILKGVKALHKANIIHRDIKASNILFRDKNHLVIADLGSAKSLTDDTDITLHGEVIGTPYYMSPEQFNGEKVDPRSDIFSLGILFYEMLTGQKPFRGDNVMEIVYKQSYEKPALLPKSLSKYQNIINTLLAYNREDRYQSIDDIIQAIKNTD